MKKIVALVLCLALALSLCTVAFAEKLFKVDDLGHVNTALGSDYTVHEKYAGDTGNKEFPTYYFKNDNVTQDGYYIITDAANADYALGNGTVKNYYLEIGAKYDLTWTAKASLVDYDDVDYIEEDESCGKVVSKGTDNDFYVDADGNYYVTTTYSDGVKLLNVDGKAIPVKETEVVHVWWDDDTDAFVTDNTDYTGKAMNGETLYLIDHNVVGKAEIDKKTGKTVIEDVECDNCDAAVAYLTSFDAAQSKWGLNKFHAVELDLENATNNENATNKTTTIYVPCAGTVKAAGSNGGSGSTVESAKTFDAGIALYAGMALASVAGSAVVIGKKKEF